MEKQERDKILNKLNSKKLLGMVMGGLWAVDNDHPEIIDMTRAPSVGKRITGTIYAEIKKVVNSLVREVQPKKLTDREWQLIKWLLGMTSTAILEYMRFNKNEIAEIRKLHREKFTRYIADDAPITRFQPKKWQLVSREDELEKEDGIASYWKAVGNYLREAMGLKKR